MSARYLLRFDDLTPAMNWRIWNELESILRKHRVVPILAVVPDNRDPDLVVDAPEESFWERVQAWQTWGWTIGLHGYQHLLKPMGHSLVGTGHVSEFAGLSRAEQEHKLRQALDIFERHEIRPDVWVAPAHSFDQVTLAVLRDLGLDTVSDGFSLFPHRDRGGTLWIPQQFWRFRRAPIGVWTVCLHHNIWTEDRLEAFETALIQFLPSISEFGRIRAAYTHSSQQWLDQCATVLLDNYWRIRKRAQRLRA